MAANLPRMATPSLTQDELCTVQKRASYCVISAIFSLSEQRLGKPEMICIR
jgi:hypothetical protein